MKKLHGLLVVAALLMAVLVMGGCDSAGAANTTDPVLSVSPVRLPTFADIAGAGAMEALATTPPYETNNFESVSVAGTAYSYFNFINNDTDVILVNSVLTAIQDAVRAGRNLSNGPVETFVEFSTYEGVEYKMALSIQRINTTAFIGYTTIRFEDESTVWRDGGTDARFVFWFSPNFRTVTGAFESKALDIEVTESPFSYGGLRFNYASQSGELFDRQLKKIEGEGGPSWGEHRLMYNYGRLARSGSTMSLEIVEAFHDPSEESNVSNSNVLVMYTDGTTIGHSVVTREPEGMAVPVNVFLNMDGSAGSEAANITEGLNQLHTDLSTLSTARGRFAENVGAEAEGHFARTEFPALLTQHQTYVGELEGFPEPVAP